MIYGRSVLVVDMGLREELKSTFILLLQDWYSLSGIRGKPLNRPLINRRCQDMLFISDLSLKY